MCIAVAEPYVYWARTLLEGANSPAIMTALVNDPAPSSVVLVDNITGPQCIATDPANVYWTTDRGLVQKWSLIDRELETLANDDEQGLSGIAVSSDHVYYLSPAALRRVPIDGGAPETLAKNLVRGSRVAVDDAHAYFTSLGDDETAGSLSRVALDGGPDDVEVLYTSQGTLGGKTNAEMWDLELDDSSVYATDFGGARVVKRAKAANSPQ